MGDNWLKRVASPVGLFSGGGGGGGSAKAIKPELPSPETVAKYIFPIGTKENPGYPTIGHSLDAFPGAAQYAASTMLPFGDGGGGGNGGLGLGIAAGADILSAALGSSSPTMVPGNKSGLGSPVDLSGITGGGSGGSGDIDWMQMAMTAAKFAPMFL